MFKKPVRASSILHANRVVKELGMADSGKENISQIAGVKGWLQDSIG